MDAEHTKTICTGEAGAQLLQVLEKHARGRLDLRNTNHLLLNVQYTSSRKYIYNILRDLFYPFCALRI